MIVIQLFIWPLIIGFIIFKINPFNKEKNKLKRVIYIFIPLLLLLISITFSIIFGWVKGRRQEAVMITEDYPKEIYFLNKTNKSIN